MSNAQLGAPISTQSAMATENENPLTGVLTARSNEASPMGKRHNDACVDGISSSKAAQTTPLQRKVDTMDQPASADRTSAKDKKKRLSFFGATKQKAEKLERKLKDQEPERNKKSDKPFTSDVANGPHSDAHGQSRHSEQVHDNKTELCDADGDIKETLLSPVWRLYGDKL